MSTKSPKTSKNKGLNLSTKLEELNISTLLGMDYAKAALALMWVAALCIPLIFTYLIIDYGSNPKESGTAKGEPRHSQLLLPPGP
jgi:hypothetical protein